MTARLIDDVKLKVESNSNSKQTTAAGNEKNSKNNRQQHPNLFGVANNFIFLLDRKKNRPSLVNSRKTNHENEFLDKEINRKIVFVNVVAKLDCNLSSPMKEHRHTYKVLYKAKLSP